jgi:tetratricopeptide (TPR) repeat protein
MGTSQSKSLSTNKKKSDNEEKDSESNQEVIHDLKMVDLRALLLNGNSQFHDGVYDQCYISYMSALGELMNPPKHNIDDITQNDIMNLVDEVQRQTEFILQDIGQKDNCGGLNSALKDMNTGLAVATSLQSNNNKCVSDSIVKMKDHLRLCDLVSDLMNNLGATSFVQGNLEDSMEQHMKSLSLRRVCEGERSLAAAESLQNLANCYERLGRLQEAESMLLLALQVEGELDGGKECTENTSTLNNLAVLYSHMDRLEESESLLNTVVKSRKSLLGTTHRLTICAQRNLNVVKEKMKMKICTDRVLSEDEKEASISSPQNMVYDKTEEKE